LPGVGDVCKDPMEAERVMISRLKDIFKLVDTDNSDAIEPHELVELFATFYGGTNQAKVLDQATKTIEAYDGNGDGVMQFPEFVDMAHYGGFWKRFGFGADWFEIHEGIGERIVEAAKNGVPQDAAPQEAAAAAAPQPPVYKAPVARPSTTTHASMNSEWDQMLAGAPALSGDSSSTDGSAYAEFVQDSTKRLAEIAAQPKPPRSDSGSYEKTKPLVYAKPAARIVPKQQVHEEEWSKMSLDQMSPSIG